MIKDGKFAEKAEKIKGSFENFFTDFSSLTGNFAAVAVESGKNIKDKARESLHNLLLSMDFVTREEFEIVRKMAEKALAENEGLRKKVENITK